MASEKAATSFLSLQTERHRAQQHTYTSKAAAASQMDENKKEKKKSQRKWLSYHRSPERMKAAAAVEVENMTEAAVASAEKPTECKVDWLKPEGLTRLTDWLG